MTSTAKATKASELNSQTKRTDISIVSLDTLTTSQRLNPGEPFALAPGVTISVLQSAAEALLEIDQSATATTLVNNMPTSEVVTVQSGQIIKTSEGRFVMIRHLEALIVPRTSEWKRPDEIQQAIDLAVSTHASMAKELQPKESKSQAEVSARPVIDNKNSKRNILRAAIGVCAVILAGLFFFGPNDQKSGLDAPANKTLDPQAAPVPNAQSRIIAVPASSDVETPASAESEPLQPKSKEGSSGAKTRPSTPEKTSPAPALKAATTQNDTGSQPDLSGLRKVVATSKSGSNKVELTQKDRDTIAEYKLEARFDRVNARAKLKHMANSFPVGSPARRDVERAYNSL